MAEGISERNRPLRASRTESGAQIASEAGLFFTDLPFKRVARRGPVNTPVEIDLRQHTDVKIVCIPPGVNPFDPPMALGANGTKQAQ